MKRILCLLLALIMVAGLLCACGSGDSDSASGKSKKEESPFVGKWECYKVVGGGDEIVFADYSAYVEMEMTVEFDEDGTYIVHYYVNGEEGDKYPQSGTYEEDGDRIILDDGDNYGEIVDGELILYYDNAQVQQYYTK